MVGPSGRWSKGKKKIEIRPIENEGRQHVTFSKRRSGLFKKASELSTLCGAPVAVVAFSNAGRAFALLGDPTAESLLRRYSLVHHHPDVTVPHAVAAHAGGAEEVVDALRRAAEETTARLAAERARMSDAAEKIAAGRELWWDDADVEALGEAELSVFDMALRRLKGDVCRRLLNTASARRRLGSRS